MPATAITEQDGVHQQWYVEAKAQRIDTLPEFLRHLQEDYQHDYGTMVHATAAAALATAWAMDAGPSGGITGFQAEAIAWEFWRNWLSEQGPLRMVRFEKMLYPQYAGDFQKTITPRVWAWLQEEARKNLSRHDELTHGAVVAHWRSIERGVVPFGYRIAEG